MPPVWHRFLHVLQDGTHTSQRKPTNHQLKPRDLPPYLKTFSTSPGPLSSGGAPGIGKSSIVRQIAERRRMPLIDIRASLLDPTDLRGIPMIQDGTAVWCPPSFLPKKSDKPGILFLDEINAAPPLVQAALYQLILDRRVGEYELPEGWRIIAAGNRREDKAVTFRLSSALANRFIHLNLEVDPDDWHAWATNHGIIPEVTAFLKYRPQLLQAASEDEQAFATPRSWEMVSDVVAKFGSPAKARDVIPGIVGTGPAVEFLTFAKKAVLRKEIDAIIADPAGATIPTELDRLWVLVSFLVAGAQNDGILKIVPTLLPPPARGVQHRASARPDPVQAPDRAGKGRQRLPQDQQGHAVLRRAHGHLDANAHHTRAHSALHAKALSVDGTDALPARSGGRHH